MRRSERFERYAHPLHQSRAYQDKVGVVDAFTNIAHTKVSNSRHGMSPAGSNLVLATSLPYSPICQGMNVYPMQLENSTELFDPGAIETLVFALAEQDASHNITAYVLMAFDGTYVRLLHRFQTHLRIDMITYALGQGYYLIGCYDADTSSARAFKYESTGITEVSTGLPANIFVSGCLSKYDNCLYIIMDAGSDTTVVMKFDGSTWTNLGTIVGAPVRIRPAATNGSSPILVIAANSASEPNIKYWDGISFYTCANSLLNVSDFEIFPGTPPSPLVNSLGIAYRLFYESTDFSVISIFGPNSVSNPLNTGSTTVSSMVAVNSSIVYPMISTEAMEMYLMLAWNTGIRPRAFTAMKYYPAHPNANPALITFESEQNIYDGRQSLLYDVSPPDESGIVEQAPYYLAQLFKGISGLREKPLFFLPFSNVSSTSATDGIDLWSRSIVREEPVWKCEHTFDGYMAINNGIDNIIPGDVGKIF